MSFKEAAGIFYKDRFMPIVESIVNLVASIVLLKIFGLAGVFLGTAVSSLVILLYSYPKYVYIPLFNKQWKNYYKEFIKYIIYAAFIISMSMIINRFIHVGNVFVQAIISTAIALIIPTIIICVIFFKTEEFKYYIGMIKSILLKIFRRNKKDIEIV